MLRKLVPVFVCILLLAFVVPAFASGTSIIFNDAHNSALTSTSHTFKGIIVTPYHPSELTYRYQVYTVDTNTLIDSSGRTRTLAEGSGSYANNAYTQNFSFTAQFGTYTGLMNVYLEVWNGTELIERQRLRVKVLPIVVTLNQKDDLIITGDNYDFTGVVTSYSDTVKFSYKVMDNKKNVIDQSRTASPVFITRTRTLSQLYEYTVTFNAKSGDYTGLATIVLEATDGAHAAKQTISVWVQRPVRFLPQGTDFKNHGQLVSYIVSELQVRGHGNHKNLGQALQYARQHPDFTTLRTKTEVNHFLRNKVLPATVVTGKPNKK